MESFAGKSARFTDVYDAHTVGRGATRHVIADFDNGFSISSCG
jgi:hypothetical protein